jgi:hypothetical protein
VPNTRPKGVVDGEQVNIPALPVQDGTLGVREAGLSDCLRAFMIPIHPRTAEKTVPETVLKLTQVGEMSILRRSRERS